MIEDPLAWWQTQFTGMAHVFTVSLPPQDLRARFTSWLSPHPHGR